MFVELYRCLMTCIFPILRVTYIQKRKKQGKEHQTRFNERLGIYTKSRPNGKLIWLHGASVGEAVSMLPLIDRLLKEDQNLSVMVTTGTLTSAEIMEKRLPPRAFHQFIPFDVPSFAKGLLDHFKPDAVLWFESELWPSLLYEIHQREIPLILVNGRVSDKSFAVWKRFKFVAKEILGCFSLCLGQSELDKNRLILLGAKKAACFGNIKYAGQALPVDTNELNALKTIFSKRRIFLISSTHHNEEELLLQYMPMLVHSVPNVMVIVVPRHPNRGKEVADLFIRHNFDTALRSKGQPVTENTAVYVADTIGEMGLWYALAEVVFVGGSLIPHGGQNFMEPARDKCAVIVGPHMHNFKEMLYRGKSAHAVWQFDNASDIMEEVINLFSDDELLRERQQDAYSWTVKEGQVLDGICQVLNRELQR